MLWVECARCSIIQIKVAHDWEILSYCFKIENVIYSKSEGIRAKIYTRVKYNVPTNRNI